jgi:hypothetical protein
MTLVKTTANLIAVLAMSCCLVPATWGQAAAQATTPTQASKPKASHKQKPGVVAAQKTTAAPDAKPDVKSEGVVAKRDPFIPLVNDKKASGPPLPPGKAGLVIATVRVDGTVKAASGMLAVVTNPDQRTYFIREGDQLYDGDVEKIGLDGVTFKENSKDAFGKPVEKLVTKRIYPSAGEQQ